MANIWDEFDKAYDAESLAIDIAEGVENNSNSYDEVPDGTYEVAITNMEQVVSKSGKPMVNVTMKIIEGDYKGRLIFWHKVITQKFMFRNKYKNGFDDFLESLVSEMENPIEVVFKTYDQHAELVMEIMEAIENNFEYFIKKSHRNNSDYPDFYVEEVYVLED